MEIKEEIENVLEFLKKAGYDRGAIEKELEYSVNYIDQVLSKGGNKRFLKAIKKFKNQVLQKAIPENKYASMVEDSGAIYEKILPLGDLRITLKDYFNLLMETARKAEEREREYLDIIKQKLISIDTNSKELADDIAALISENQAAHRAIMDSVDVAAEQPIGTSRAAAGIVEIASEEERVGKGKKASVSKPD